MQTSCRYLCLVFIIVSCTSQKAGFRADTSLRENIEKHILFLADDKLEGRRAGSPGEKLAMEYIANQFELIGIAPKGTNGWFQPFEIHEGKQIHEGTYFFINNKKLEVGKDFFPFPFSGGQPVEATPAIALRESDMPWFYDLKDVLEENKENPHFDLHNYIHTNAKKARERGASAVILYNTSAFEDNLVFIGKEKSEPLTLPVFYIKKHIAQEFFKDESATVEIKVRADIAVKKSTGHNVVGYIDNGAAKTVVSGAHFDHLGYGEDGNSMMRNAVRAIHNGADDNASGTAALIEMARLLKNTKARNSNYLFIAFSGEELGLFGSKYFTDNPTVDLKSATYMINMDMVGRFNDSSRTLTIGGFGTSPAWGEVVKPGSSQLFVFRYDSSGVGPSDHTSFYRKDIPVLFYFTGLHSDYHKPTDDAEKINYEGAAKIVRHIYSIIETLDNQAKLVFTKTRETQMSTSQRFRVTLGIMPDYTFTGTGVRADGVTENRPAAVAGLKTGDIIVQLGSHNITSMESYMEALGKFNKGDKTTVKFIRGSETLEAPVEF